MHLRAAAHTLELLLHKNAQQLALRLHRHVRDLVDIERAAMRFLQRADLARRCPIHLGAEKLDFNTIRRHRRSVHGDKRRVGAVRAGMQDARGQLLARAGRAR